MLESLQYCMVYQVILERVITALDCTNFVDKRYISIDTYVAYTIPRWQ